MEKRARSDDKIFFAGSRTPRIEWISLRVAYVQEKKQYDGALKKYVYIKVTREDTGRILYAVYNSII